MKQLCHMRELITASDCVSIFGSRHDVLKLWDANLDTMSILTKSILPAEKLQMLQTVGAYSDFLVLRPQLFNLVTSWYFKRDFYGLQRCSGIHGGDISMNTKAVKILLGQYVAGGIRNQVELLKFMI